MQKNYMKYCKRTKALKTCNLYSFVLENIRNFHKKPIENLTELEILEYLQKRNDLSLNSRKLFLTIIKSFFKYCLENINRGITIEEVRLELDITQRYNRIINFKIPNFLKGDENKEKAKLYYDGLLKLLKSAFNRDKEIIILLAYFGFRKSELLSLKYDNIDFNNNKIRIQTAKTKKWRNLFFIDKISPILQNFLSYKDSLNYDSINSFLLKYKDILGFRIYPHLFRHLFNTEMRKKLQNDFILKKLMGHTFRDMTDSYTNVTEEDLRKAMTEQHYLKKYLEDN